MPGLLGLPYCTLVFLILIFFCIGVSTAYMILMFVSRQQQTEKDCADFIGALNNVALCSLKTLWIVLKQ